MLFREDSLKVVWVFAQVITKTITSAVMTAIRVKSDTVSNSQYGKCNSERFHTSTSPCKYMFVSTKHERGRTVVLGLQTKKMIQCTLRPHIQE